MNLIMILSEYIKWLDTVLVEKLQVKSVILDIVPVEILQDAIWDIVLAVIFLVLTIYLFLLSFYLLIGHNSYMSSSLPGGLFYFNKKPHLVVRLKFQFRIRIIILIFLKIWL